MFRKLEALFAHRSAANEKPVRDVAALAAPLAGPAVQVVKTDAPSRSHFGGSPNLPPDIPWPECRGRRLEFLARLSLPDVHRALPIDWLPDSGALLFFYDAEEQPWGFDPKDRGGWTVVLAPDLPEAVPQPVAADANAACELQHANVAFRRIDVYPSAEREGVRVLDLTEKESELYLDLADRPFDGEPRHQVSGFPCPVQGDRMELECQLAANGIYVGDATGYRDRRAEALNAGAANWRLLFQMDTDDDLGVMWGDCGMLYYWVEEQAAREGSFANAWLVLQCS